MKKLLFIGLGSILALLLFIPGALQPEHSRDAPVVMPRVFSESATVQISGRTVKVSVARTPAELERGLGGRAGLASGEGMLFIFDRDSRYGFWMKDMRFSIDIVWIASNGSIIYIAPNVSPDTYPHVFTPDAAARYVLELPAGYMAQNNIYVGANVVIHSFQAPTTP